MARALGVCLRLLTFGLPSALMACAHSYAPPLLPATLQHAPDSFTGMRLCVTAERPSQDDGGFLMTVAKAFRDAGVTVVNTEDEPCDFRIVVEAHNYEGDRYWGATLRPWEDRFDIHTEWRKINYQTNTWVARYTGGAKNASLSPLAAPGPPPPPGFEPRATNSGPKAHWDTVLPVKALNSCRLHQVLIPRQRVPVPADYDERVAAHYVNDVLSCDALGDLEQWLASQHLRAIDACVDGLSAEVLRGVFDACEEECASTVDVQGTLSARRACDALAKDDEDRSICRDEYAKALAKQGVETPDLTGCVERCSTPKKLEKCK